MNSQAPARSGMAATVALYITAAYWFTSSTSFANPAITVARSLSDTFAGIVPAFVAAQIADAVLAAVAGRRLFGVEGKWAFALYWSDAIFRDGGSGSCHLKSSR